MATGSKFRALRILPMDEDGRDIRLGKSIGMPGPLKYLAFWTYGPDGEVQYCAYLPVDGQLGISAQGLENAILSLEEALGA